MQAAAGMDVGEGLHKQRPGLTEQQQASLEWLLAQLDQMAGEDKRELFKRPVDGSVYPTYHQVIQEPMCFDQIRQKLAQQQYRTLRGFQHDLELIFKNAKTFNQPASNPVHKLAVSMLKTVSKALTLHEMAVRHHLYNLHPDGPAAAAEEEVSFLQIDPACDAAWSQSILHAHFSTQQQQQGANTPAHQAQQQQQHGLKQQQQQQVQQQPQQQPLPPRPEDLGSAHTLWEPEQPQQVLPADQGLFSILPANSISSCLQQQRHAVLYQPYPGMQQQQPSSMPAPLPPQQPQQALQQVQDSSLQQQQKASQQQQQDTSKQLQQADVQHQQQQAGAQQQQQQQEGAQQEGAQQQDTSKQQQQQVAPLPPEWQQAKQPIAWRCQWLHLRLLELQSLVNLLSAPGSTTHSKLAAGAAAAAAAGDPAGASTGVAAAAAAADTLPALRVQQGGKLQKQHVDAVLPDSIRQGAFFAAQAAACGSAAKAEQQQQQQEGQPPAAAAGGAAVAAAAAADAMDVDNPQQQQQQASSAKAAAAPSSTPAAAPSSTPAAGVSAAVAQQLCRSVFATPAHPSDAALLFSGLDLVEKQLVSAKLALGKAFGLDVSWAPAGVRLGQYAAVRLQASEGAAAAAAQGQKRSAAAAGLAQRNAAAAGGGQGGRQLQREGSMAGSQKKRRMERSSLGAVGAISMEEDAVMSPNASRQMTERLSVSIHIPAVRELPTQEQAAIKAAATTWHQAVTAHGARHAMARPPSEVRAVLDAAVEAEGSSSEDTSDEAFERLHAPLLEEERIRLNPVGGGRKRNKNKLQQQNSKFDGPPFKQLQREASTAGGPTSAAAAADGDPASPPGRHRAKKQGTGPAGGLERATSAAAGAAGGQAASTVSRPNGPIEPAGLANANQSTATSTLAGAAGAQRAGSPAKASAGAGPGANAAPAAAGAVRKVGLNLGGPLDALDGPTGTAAAAGNRLVSPRHGRPLKVRQQLQPLNGVGLGAAPSQDKPAAASGAAAAGRPVRSAIGATAAGMVRSSSGGVPATQPNGPVAAAGGNGRPVNLQRRNSAGAPTPAAATAAGDAGHRSTSGRPQSAAAIADQKGAAVAMQAAAAAGKDASGRRRSVPQIADGPGASDHPLVSPTAVGAGAGRSSSRGRGTSPQPRGSSKSPSAAAAAAAAAAGAGALQAAAGGGAGSVAASTRHSRAVAAAASQRASRSKSKGAPGSGASDRGAAGSGGKGRGKGK